VRARLAIGLLSTAEALGWIGREAGVFARLGVDLEIVRTETTGPVAAAGLADGAWDFADVGAAPIVEANFQGRDTVVVLAAEAYGALFLVGRAGIDRPEAIVGGRVGVLSRGGQMELSAIAILSKWGIRDRVRIEVLGTSSRIYDALAMGAIEAGMLTADFRFWGARDHGMHALSNVGEEFRHVGPCLAASRAFLDREHATAAATVRGFVETIHVFKTERARVMPMLSRYLGIDDAAVVAAIHDFYAARFQRVPVPPEDGLRHLIETYAPLYPDAGTRTLADVTAPEFVASLVAEGAIARLYGAG